MYSRVTTNTYLYTYTYVQVFAIFRVQFDWTRYITEVFSRAGLEVTEDEDVVVYAPQYLVQMAQLVADTSPRWAVFLGAGQK